MQKKWNPHRLLPQLVIQVSQTFSCIIKLPFGLLRKKIKPTILLFYILTNFHWNQYSLYHNAGQDLLGLLLRAGSVARGHQRWFWGSCVQLGFPSAPPSQPAAAEGAEHNRPPAHKHCHDILGTYITVENSNNRPLLETDLYIGLLRGSRGDLGVVVRLWGLHWETHNRSCDGGWWSVVIRDLHAHKKNNMFN